MSSDEIIEALELTSKLMELHQENPFKAKAYANAAFKLNKMRYQFEGKSQEDIESIEGIGKGISARIVGMLYQNDLGELRELIDKTPKGIIEILNIKGLGPNKVRQLWKELDVESIGDLLYACNENRLTTLKGFGEKTQLMVKKNIEFKFQNFNKIHYATLEQPVLHLLEVLKTKEKHIHVALVGEMLRKNEVIESIQVLTSGELRNDYTALLNTIPLPVEFITSKPEEFYYRLVETSSKQEHLVQCDFSKLNTKHFKSEEEVYKAMHLPFIEPELREGLGEVELARRKGLPKLIEDSDIKGILHCHSTYSDGVHTLKEMADACRQLGYDYFGICDHSRSAFYANGLNEERIIKQHAEVDALNKEYHNFRILKGIESDILNDGSLDYSTEVLKLFDFIVASVHSNLKMDEEKATKRLIKAIENPYTSILGHPTGRLLLARPGYPIHHRKVIDACAANNVSIELNAHPYRLDIDWRWLPYCMEKGVMISVNPDAHHKEGIKDTHFGVCVARKGRLDKTNCLNALNLPELISKFGR